MILWEGRDGAQEIEADLEGQIDDGDVTLQWVAEINMGGGGGEQEVEGWAELD